MRRSSPVCVWALLLGPAVALAAPPSERAERLALIGNPTAIEAASPTVILSGAHATRQLLVTGRYADGSVRDLTAVVEWRASNDSVVEIRDTFVRGKRDGISEVIADAGALSCTIRVEVKNFAVSPPVSFRRDVVAALNVGGCNAGACHGTPSGKNGFRLSLRGYDPAQDYVQLTRDVLGRRTDRLDPPASLFLQKGMGRVPHEGGARFGSDGAAAELIAAWMTEGMRDDPPGLSDLQEIEVVPGSRVLRAPARLQQLAVLGRFSDGSVCDVTRLTVFSSSDPNCAEVSASGLVEFKQAGEIAILCRYLEKMQAVRFTYLEPREGVVWSSPPEVNFIDRLTFAKLKQMSIPPSGLCSDEQFVRRAFLDLCGLLPSPEETLKFIADKTPEKRANLIDALLDRPEYADFWALKWSDVFRSSRKTIQTKGSYSFQAYLRDRIAANVPFDAIIKELLASCGSSSANPAVNYYRVTRDPQNLAETTAQLFFGVRMQCARCHNHPFERWTQDDYYSTAAWFARVRVKADATQIAAAPNGKQAAAEIVCNSRDGEVTQPRSGKVMPPKFLGGKVASIPPGADRRQVFAEWLTAPENPFFAKSVANRIWFHLVGKGVVDPVDDFRESNPSCNDELLDAVARHFAENKFDVKKLIRAIMNSRVYQLSAQPNEWNKDDTRYFSHAVTRQLSAEQLLDALCDVTGVPEKFNGLPAGTRAIQLPDGEVNHPFLKAFGQPARELVCECEREADSNLGQALQLINGPTINEKIRNPNNRLGELLGAKKSDVEVLDQLYLLTLSRLPTEAERTPALSHVGRHEDKRRAWEDLLWALINTREFLFRH